jgi:hypothetical protein
LCHIDQQSTIALEILPDVVRFNVREIVIAKIVSGIRPGLRRARAMVEPKSVSLHAAFCQGSDLKVVHRPQCIHTNRYSNLCSHEAVVDKLNVVIRLLGKCNHEGQLGRIYQEASGPR